MSDLKKDEVPSDVYKLYDRYAHNELSRRQFVEQLSMYAVGGLTVPALLDFLLPKYDQGIQVSADDPSLNTTTVAYESHYGGGTIGAQLSRPTEAAAPLPGIIVVHENRGLTPHIADVGLRAAKAGFISVAPDMLSPLGGYRGTDDDGRSMQATRNRDEMLEDFIAAFYFLNEHPECSGKIGVVGFCFGGWIANMMAVKVPELLAAVAYYGSQADPANVPAIRASLQFHFAEVDERVNATWPAYEDALKAHGKAYEVYHYPGSQHAFHNESTPRYDEASAKLAWSRTIDFFRQKLV